MRTPILPALILAAVASMAAGRAARTWTFDADPVGAVAPGFTVESGDWKVVAPLEGTHAFAQLAESPDSTFNVALADGPIVRDISLLSVKLKAVAGVNDQGGGLIWRARDARNYYVARFNHLEDNFRVYKVVDGRRSPPFQSADRKHHGRWHALRVTMMGDHIECYLDGQKLLDVRDSTFPDAGRVGLWSKADARSLFDDLSLVGD